MAYRALIVSSLVAMLAHPVLAHADVVTIERGAPASKKSVRTLKQSLAQAAAAASVCFQRKAPSSIRVDLELSPSGQVSRASHKNGDAVGQCLAGVLAVHTLPATGERLSLRVSFDTAALSGGSIDAALAPYRSRLEACQDKAADKRRGGRATIRFVIAPDGTVSDPQVQDSELGDARVERCLIDTMKRARLGQGVVAKKVRYALGVDFPAGGSSATRSRARGSDGTQGDSLQPQKHGPHEGAEISAVMNRNKDAFNKCYAREARKNRSLAGRVVLRFTIRGNGSVRNAKVKETTLGNARVETCLVKVVEKQTFPGASGETRVFYPFAFSTR